jgi:hypothetical protein
MNLKIDEHDRKLLFEAICFYDMHKDELFNPDQNDSFHYLYSALSDT